MHKKGAQMTLDLFGSELWMLRFNNDSTLHRDYILVFIVFILDTHTHIGCSDNYLWKNQDK